MCVIATIRTFWSNIQHNLEVSISGEKLGLGIIQREPRSRTYSSVQSIGDE
jgi:hypothetical protein